MRRLLRRGGELAKNWKEPEMNKCLACSRMIPEEGSFCPYCGYKSTISSEAPTIPSVDSPAVSKSARIHRSSTPAGSGMTESRFMPGSILLERYRLVGLIGKGGMGEVYRADDLKLGQAVALKFLPEELNADESRLERFLGEVRLARQISHPNVCRVHDVGEVNGQHFLSMEYVDGEDLASLQRRIGRLPQSKAIQLARQLCAGLSAAHQEGILHRDLKPANVMIDGRGRVRITDFGLAGLAENLAGDEVRAGTPAYMAPEQLAGREVSVRSDIYALGLVLYELFTGEPPHKASTPAELIEKRRTPPTSPSTLVSGLEPSVEAVILRCLDSDPERRPRSALAVSAALPGGDPLAEALAAGETPSPELVAAARAGESLGPWQAVTFFVLFIGLCFGFLLMADRVGLIQRVQMDKKPEALEENAGEILRSLGHEVQNYRVYGFSVDQKYLQWVQSKTEDEDKWSWLDTVFPPPVYYWYRQHDEPLVARNYVGFVTYGDPERTIPRSASLKLDARGRLLELLVMPPEFETPESIEGEGAGAGPEGRAGEAVDWSQLFVLAGLDITNFQPVDPIWNPPLACDTRVAWTGSTGESESQLELRVEAGALGSDPVFFKVIPPWLNPEEGADTAGALPKGESVALVIVLVILGIAIFMARRNFLRGRGDLKGGLRLAAYVVILYLVGFWALRVQHVASYDELLMLRWAVGASLFLGVIVWVLYLALEPYVRRIWPGALVSWTRVLSGRIRDPLVGSDLLVGGLVGAWILFVLTFSHLAEEWLGGSARMPMGGAVDCLASMKHALSCFFSMQTSAVLNPLGILLFLMIFRAIFRKQWLAVGMALLVFVTLDLLGDFSWIRFGTGVLIWVPAILVLIRHGIVASFMMFYFANLAVSLPLTLDFTQWYAGRAMFLLVLAASLVVFGFYASLAGRPLIGDPLFEKEHAG